MTPPKISVVMCAFNAEPYLETALNSILNQTFSDFDFIIVDDGSTDRTASILAEYAARDQRIKILTNADNQGVPHATNRGLAAATGEYIARMDSDDIAAPARFSKQVDYLDTNQDCILVGTGYQEINASGEVIKTDCEPASAPIIQWRALFRMPFVHSSLMFRRRISDDREINFDTALVAASDFDFIIRLTQHGKAALIAEPLTQYRMHPKNISSLNTKQQRNTARHTSIREAQCLFPDIDPEIIRSLFHYLHDDAPSTLRETYAASAAMLELQAAFSVRFDLSKADSAQQDALATRWLLMAIMRRHKGRSIFSSFIHLIWARRSVGRVITETLRYAHRRAPIHWGKHFTPAAPQ